MQSFFNYIGTAVPEHKIPQSDIAKFMTKALALKEEEKKKLKVLYRASGIRTRHSVLADYASQPDQYKFFPQNETLDPFPTIDQRMRVYEKEAAPLAIRAIRNALPDSYDLRQITHLITISCTGMYAPGLDVEIVQRMGLNTTVKRTAINFMGCYGAFNGFKLASSICEADPSANVLIAAVELCTLHFNKDTEPDTLLSNALFSDGAAATLISAVETERSIRMDGFHADMAYEGKSDMAWKIGNHGFEMKLTSIVPDIIEKHILSLTDKLLTTLDVSRDEIDLFAIHPGGKRILEVIEKELDIPATHNKPAHDVLRSYGNMSSPTILFVLQNIIRNIITEDRGKKVLSFAFGPGLTMESMLLQIC